MAAIVRHGAADGIPQMRDICPPTMAQGAAIALEDAAVLSGLLVTRAIVDDGATRTRGIPRTARTAYRKRR